MYGQSRRVHFDHVAHPFSSPSSTLSDDTLASSPGPSTPPNFHFYVDEPSAPPSTPILTEISGSPGSSYPRSPRTPSPVILEDTLQIHSVLALSTHARQSSRPFVWDMSLDPASIRGPPVYGNHDYSPYALPPELLLRPATLPPLRRIAIQCDLLPWRIMVEPSNAAAPASPPTTQPFVSVSDVLNAIYDNLRLSVSRRELEAIEGQKPGSRLQIDAAYKLRCSRLTSESKRIIEEGKGIKRVDVCGRYLEFAGLTPGDKIGDMFLHVYEIPTPPAPVVYS